MADYKEWLVTVDFLVHAKTEADARDTNFYCHELGDSGEIVGVELLAQDEEDL